MIAKLCFLLIYIWKSRTVVGDDPCSSHSTLPGWIGSRNEKCNVQNGVDQICDQYLDSLWYIIIDGQLLNHCPKVGDCSSTFPAWMNGSFPMVNDGEVERVACIVRDRDCCKDNVTMKVKNCTNFFVYYLPSLLECTSTYCVESALPCDAPTTTSTTKLTVPSTVVSNVTPALQQKDDSKTILIVACSVGGVVICLIAMCIIYFVHRSMKRNLTVDDQKPPPPYTEVEIAVKPMKSV